MLGVVVGRVSLSGLVLLLNIVSSLFLLLLAQCNAYFPDIYLHFFSAFGPVCNAYFPDIHLHFFFATDRLFVQQSR